MRLVLVIDVAEDVAENYKDFTVDYDLRGTPIDDDKVNESIKYVEDADVRPLPNEFGIDIEDPYASGRNDCLRAIKGETE